jgi:hypothetical protein
MPEARTSRLRATGRALPRSAALLAVAIAVALTIPLAAPARPADAMPDPAPAGWTVRRDPVRPYARTGWLSGRGGTADRATGARPAAPGAGGAAPADRDAEAAWAAADAFLSEQRAILGVDPQDLLATDRRDARRLEHLCYRQTYRGLPVEGAHLTITLDASARAVAFSSTLVPRAVLELGVPAAAERLSPAQARERARAAIPTPGGISWDDAQLAILPTPARDAAGARIVWRLLARSPDHARAWRLLVDAVDGEVLEVRLLAMPLTGEVRGVVRAPDPWGTDQVVPFPEARVRALADGALAGETYADSLGRFELADLPAEGLTLELPLEGRGASLRAGDLAADPARIVLTDPADPVSALWDSTAASAAEREAYVLVQRARARVRGIDPGFDEPRFRLDALIPVVVHDAELACNAFASLDTEFPWLRFAGASGACADLGRTAGVVQHEYGHLVTLYAYAPDDAPGFIQEGCSDFFSASLADTPRVGLGWQGPGTFVRDLAAPLYWPVGPLCPQDPYCSGAALATSLWSLRETLIATRADRDAAVRYAETLFHFMRAGKPQTFQDCLVGLLLQDDDDNDLSNGTPNLDAIAAAFETHGLGDFTLSIEHAALADTTDALDARAVVARVGSIYPPDPAAVLLHYRVDGGAYRIDAMAREAGAGWRGLIPPQANGARVDYYITASDGRGHSGALPLEAPSSFFTYRVGTDETAPRIAHVPPEAAIAGSPRLWVHADLADNSGSLDSAWVEAALSGPGGPQSITAPLVEKRATLREALLPISGRVPGDRIEYALYARDAAGLIARLPEPGTYSIPVVRGWAQDFETGTGDLIMTGAWTRRALDSQLDAPLLPVPSGAAVIEFRAAGEAPVERAELTLPARDLSGWAHAQLAFATRYRIHEGDAGGRILLSTDGGASWQAVAPITGYPVAVDHDRDGDGTPDETLGVFAGESGAWQSVRVPLDAFAGDTLTVRFEIFGGRTPDRWLIDDLALLETPALPAPEALTASQGETGRVHLAWTPIPDADAAAHGLLGYEVLRGPAPHAYALTPINSQPVSDTRWLDRDVVDGTRYFYAVRARFAAFEGPLSPEATGHPYLPALALPDELSATVAPDGLGGDTLYVTNPGTGELRVDLYYGDSDATAETVRPVYRFGLAPPAAYVTLIEDPADAPAPDVRRVSVRSVGAQLVFRVGFETPLPDPREDFTLLILLDTDLAPGTGLAQPNIGADYILAVGRMIDRATGSLALGYLLDANGNFVERASSISAWAGADSLEVSVRRSALGSVDAFACAVQVLLAHDPPPWPAVLDGDRAPDAPAATWLAYEPRSGWATPASPLPVVLRYDLRDSPLQTQRAKLFAFTGDPHRPTATVLLAVRQPGQALLTDLVLGRPHPNPFGPETRLALEVPQGVAWRAEIVDVAGRVVRRLAAAGAGDPRRLDLIWDGFTNAGTRAPSGRYYVVARGAGLQAARPILLVR